LTLPLAPAATFTTTSASGDKVRRKSKHKQGITPQKRAALARAKVFAEGVDKDKAAVKAAALVLDGAAGSTEKEMPRSKNANPNPAKSSMSFDPSLDELLALKPMATPRGFQTAAYAKRHQKLVETIDSAFVRAQILALVRLFPPVDGRRFTVGSREPKAVIIQRILDQWGWVLPQPRHDDARDPRNERTQGEHTRISLYQILTLEEFPITAAEVFLLKRDAKVAEWLNEFKTLKVNIIVSDRDPEKQQYLFTATDVPDTLHQIETLLHSRRRSYAHLEWTAMEMQGFVPSTATLGAIASVTGAFIERTPKGTYLATGPSSDDVRRARNMVIIAATRSTSPPPPLSAALPSSNREGMDQYFSLTPHLPAMTSPLPWDTAAAVSGQPLFRLVQSITGRQTADEREVTQRAAALDAASILPWTGSGSNSNSPALGGPLSSVVGSLAAAVKPVDGGETSVVVRLGHLLVPSTGTSVLQPPIKGAWPLDKQGPLAGMPAPFFTPAVPPSLIQDPLPTTPSRVRRVTYRRAGAAERMVVSYEYPSLNPERDSHLSLPPVSQSGGKDEPSWFLRLSDMLAMPQEAKEAEAKEAEKKAEDDFELDMGGLKGVLGADLAPATEPAPMQLSFSVSTESTADVLFPERPIDARISAHSTRTLPADEVPHSLTTFFADVHAYPSAAHVPLSDIATLRTGTGLPAAPADDELYNDDSWHAAEGGQYRVEEKREAEQYGEDAETASAWGDFVASAEKPFQPETAEPKAESEPRAPPMPVATEGSVLVPPVTVLYAQEQWNLEADEVLDVCAWTRAPTVEPLVRFAYPGFAVADAASHADTETAPTPSPTSPLAPPSPSTPPPLSPVTTRTISAVDLRGPGGIVRFAELEAPVTAADGLYPELAAVSRDLVLDRLR
jgi:hypothetical protein